MTERKVVQFRGKPTKTKVDDDPLAQIQDTGYLILTLGDNLTYYFAAQGGIALPGGVFNLQQTWTQNQKEALEMPTDVAEALAEANNLMTESIGQNNIPVKYSAKSRHH